MATKKTIGPRTVTAKADTTGNNTGFWTATFDSAVMATKWSQFEVYKMVVNIANSAGVVAFTVFIGQHQYEGFQTSEIATWSDNTPMVVDSGETIYFYFNEPSTDGTPPSVTLWCQVDLDLARQTG